MKNEKTYGMKIDIESQMLAIFDNHFTSFCDQCKLRYQEIYITDVKTLASIES